MQYFCYDFPGELDVPDQDVVPYVDVPLRGPDGSYLLDYVLGQDMVAWYEQGAITDRTQEHLGVSDTLVIAYRNVLVGAALYDPDSGVAIFPLPPAAARIPAGTTRAVLTEAVEALVLMLSPFAPHMAEELWELLGHPDGVVAAGWPAADAAVAAEEAIVVPVQVNGKVRGRVSVPAGIDEASLEAAALADPAIQAHTAGKTIVKVVVAKGRLVSIVVK